MTSASSLNAQEEERRYRTVLVSGTTGLSG
jgi:hypothetical protein